MRLCGPEIVFMTYPAAKCLLCLRSTQLAASTPSLNLSSTSSNQSTRPRPLRITSMGVKGLQTFLKENRQSLCRTLVLDRDGAAERAPVPVVVDAWG